MCEVDKPARLSSTKMTTNTETAMLSSVKHSFSIVCFLSSGKVVKKILSACTLKKFCRSWENQPVMTSLETTGKDIAGLDFPAITICGQGYDLSGLEDAVNERFEEWVATRETRRKRETETEKELFIKFSEEVFGIKDPK